MSPGSTYSDISITNVLAATRLGVEFDLRKVCYEMTNTIYDPSKITCVIWRDRKIAQGRAVALLFSTGYMSVNGNRTLIEARQNVRKFARLLQKKGYSVRPRIIEILSISASTRRRCRAKKKCLDMTKIAALPGMDFEPEIFTAACLKRGRMSFLIFESGSIVITGLKESHKTWKLAQQTVAEIREVGGVTTS